MGEGAGGLRWVMEVWRRSEPLAVVLVLGSFVAIACGEKKSASPGPPPESPPLASIHPGETKIGDMKIESVSQGWGAPQLDRSVTGRPLTIAGESFRSGIGTHAISRIDVSFPAKFKTFSGACGVDEFVKSGGSVVCKVAHGDKVLFASPLLKGGMKAASFSVSVTGLSKLTLSVEDGGDDINGDNADWVDLRLK